MTTAGSNRRGQDSRSPRLMVYSFAPGDMAHTAGSTIKSLCCSW